ncbi:GGDEF domain-containing protein [Desulforamulus aeronauticus]|uniref:Diguanylate cyclase (GGDEF) domain-containing protein n=1 Tax=Desulforamulus aeronauticus DSM 10349 TaxID=1121421 RepID=A0A1M6VI31_9FIRM|nr:GGDEF domain-containing protein [Desulforamulus aeronauticus]SHK80916.1 diguanylate cyclase (GGDEF) domain-containing protein [Desulforamulus aeronauticus DSM 10349]
MLEHQNMLAKYKELLKINEKLTQLHWIVAQVAGETDLNTMHNLILNGFMQIAEVPGCHFILLDDNGIPFQTVKRSIEDNPFVSCEAYQKIFSQINTIGNQNLLLPHSHFCNNCSGECGLAMLQILPLHNKHGNPLAVLLAQHLNHPTINDETQMILELFTIQVSLALENAMLNKKFENLSITDALTGLYNHRYFAERLQKEVSLCSCMPKELCLIMLDVDKFKNYNDSFGHPAGDRVLKTMSKTFTQTIRPMDVVARYGGEEFAFILPNTSPQEGIHLAEKIRCAVANTDFAYRPITASLGVAHYPAHTPHSIELLKLADKALYQAKANGRNRVVVASDIE